VAFAQAGVDQVVAEKAKAIGPELAAALLGLKVPEVRRISRAAIEGFELADCGRG
jgi:hypothetical protein